MDNPDNIRNETRKYLIRLIIGLILLLMFIEIRNYVDAHNIVDKSQKLGGLYYSFDLGYYAIMMAGFCVSGFFILPSMIYLIKRLVGK